MNDITSISKKLWKLISRLFVLLVHLSKQVVLPNRNRKGNLLNTLFLFYIGVIENTRHLEHRRLKMADLFQNNIVRKGMMLFGFLLFLLSSYEQPVTFRSSFNEQSQVECSYQNATGKSSYACCIKYFPVKVVSFITHNIGRYCKYSAPIANKTALYLQNRRLLI